MLLHIPVPDVTVRTASYGVFTMLSRRKSYSHIFVCVAATWLLVFGWSDYVFAQGKAEPQSAAGRVDPSGVATTRSNETRTETNGTTGNNDTHTETRSSETPAQTVGPKAGNNETNRETIGTNTGNNETNTEMSGPKTGNIETHTETNGPKTGNNETHIETNGPKTGNSETHTETNGAKLGNNGTGTVSNSTQSSNTNQTAGTEAHDPPPPPPPPPVLSIFLVNDLQYDIFPVHPENGSMCDVDPEGEKCVGGLPSLMTFVDDNRANRTQSIWLNAGNTLGGDLFRTLKFDAAVRAMQLLNFSAIAVGPNVFKYGGDAGRSYLDGLNQSIVVSNIDPAQQQKSVTFPVGNCTVAVIGYLENTKLDHDIQGVSIKNYTESVLEEVKRIQKDHKNDSNLITVVIGSSSVNESKALASNEAIDFVFFSGANWSEEAKGNRTFWEPVNKPSFNKTAYVGSLRVNHSDMAGRFIVGLMELPITNGCRVVNASFKFQDYTNSTSNKTALEVIKLELERLQIQNKPLTLNTKNLTAERDLCSHSECSLGNLITDAMVAALNDDSTWSGNATRIGIFPAAQLQPNVTIPEGDVTVVNLYGLIDQDAYIYSILLTGWQLKDILEVSINCSSNSNSTDFLHVSRLLQIEYRKNRDNTSEIVSVKTVSAVSSSMLLSEIDVNDNTTFYNVSIPLTLLKMNSYKKLLGAVNASFHSVTIVEAVTRYINNTGALPLPVIGSRFILFESNPEPTPPPPNPCANHTGTTVAVTLVVAALVVGLIFGVWRWRSIRSHLLPGYVNF